LVYIVVVKSGRTIARVFRNAKSVGAGHHSFRLVSEQNQFLNVIKEFLEHGE